MRTEVSERDESRGVYSVHLQVLQGGTDVQNYQNLLVLLVHVKQDRALYGST